MITKKHKVRARNKENGRNKINEGGRSINPIKEDSMKKKIEKEMRIENRFEVRSQFRTEFRAKGFRFHSSFAVAGQEHWQCRTLNFTMSLFALKPFNVETKLIFTLNGCLSNGILEPVMFLGLFEKNFHSLKKFVFY